MLTRTNKDMQIINGLILGIFPKEFSTNLSADLAYD
jgi:hypothetical protein